MNSDTELLLIAGLGLGAYWLFTHPTEVTKAVAQLPFSVGNGVVQGAYQGIASIPTSAIQTVWNTTHKSQMSTDFATSVAQFISTANPFGWKL